MAGQQEELCFSLVLHSTSQWNCTEALLNAELCYSQDISNHHFVIFKAPPTLVAHATRPKFLSNFAKFHWISPICMVMSRKKQCSVSLVCSTLQCTRATDQYNPNNWNYHWTCPICMAGQQQELCLSLVLQRTSQWTRAEATKPCANRKTSYTISLSSLLVPPTLLAHATRLKSLQISIRSAQSAW